MAIGRNPGLRGLTYRGGGAMLSWMLHRLGGLAMVLFVGTHILASFSMQQYGSNLGTFVNTIYESSAFQIVLYFFVIFHVLNGLRIILLDIWPQYLVYQREATWIQWIILVPTYSMAVLFLVRRAISGG